MTEDHHRAPRVSAIFIGAIGLGMLASGLELVWLGGSFFYASAGLLMFLSAIELFRGSSRGFVLFGLVLLLNLAWSVYETGSDIWLTGSRIWLIGLISIWLCMPWVRRRLWPDPMPALITLRTFQVGALASTLVLGSMVLDLLSEDIRPITTPALPVPEASDWSAYGASERGTRYAALTQINKENVPYLKQAWRMETGRVGRFSGTPIQIGDGLYLCTAQNVMIALDPDSGEERWRYDPENKTPPYGILGNCRGVTYYSLPDAIAGEVCAERIFTATTDARMIAVDKQTGRPCEDFGENGQISLLAGMGEVKPLYYFVTSPPTVASGTLVVGGWVMDNREVDEPSGVVRAYDPRTGELVWAWDMGREGETQMPNKGETYTRGTPNVWSLMSADDELGLVYVPTGNATPDYFGGHRTQVMDKYASSVVAIDAKTGLTRWHFQTTHHDVWDYDVPSQPTLVDIRINDQVRKAVVVPTKRSEIFVLDRETGEPLTEVTERPVPQTDLPGERSSATQPFSTGMPSFAYPRLTEADLFGYTPFDQIACRKTFLRLRYEGPMTPPSVEGTVLYPGPAGGMNWGSVAVDPARGLLVVNTLQLPWVVHMIPQEPNQTNAEAPPDRGYGIGGPQLGTPFAARVLPLSSPLALPCIKPPIGEMAVVDLATQKVIWRKGMGLGELGFPYAAGSIVTAGGLIFHAAIADGYVRAIDVETGAELWAEALRSPSDATPMTYTSPKTGRQYLLVTLPGQAISYTSAHEDPDNPSTTGGGEVIAYALPP